MDVTSLLGNVGASAAGSIISKTVLYPLDTVAVQFQTSTRRSLLSIPLKAYYRGIGVTLLTVTPATALYLTTREAAQIALLPHLGDGALNDAVSVSASGFESRVNLLAAIRMYGRACGKRAFHANGGLESTFANQQLFSRRQTPLPAAEHCKGGGYPRILPRICNRNCKLPSFQRFVVDHLR